VTARGLGARGGGDRRDDAHRAARLTGEQPAQEPIHRRIIDGAPVARYGFTVRQPVDARLIEEIRTWRLRFTCPDCLYFVPDDAARGAGSCAHFWPNAEHLAAPSADPVTDGAGAQNHLVFCKEFDLR
jgi:hypothetical protein